MSINTSPSRLPRPTLQRLVYIVVHIHHTLETTQQLFGLGKYLTEGRQTDRQTDRQRLGQETPMCEE
ncbi:hypothetical protein J6590_042425, partial [Homalodisca vitripennis]